MGVGGSGWLRVSNEVDCSVEIHRWDNLAISQ